MNTIIIFTENILRNVSDYCTVSLTNSGIHKYIRHSITYEILPKGWAVSLNQKDDYITFEGKRLPQFTENPVLHECAEFVDDNLL